MKRFVVLIAVIGLLSTFLFFGCVDTREEHKQLLMDSLEKQLAIPDEYQINSIETVQGIALDITIAKSSNEKVLITESELDTKWVFLKDDLNFICEQKKSWDGNILCAETTNDTRFSREISSAESRFISAEVTEDAKVMFETLIDEDALFFDKTIVNKTIAERPCRQITMEIDYNKLSVENLRKIGLSSNDPFVNKYQNITQTMCYDLEYGNPLYIKLSYINEGEEVVFERIANSFTTDVDPSIFELPNKTIEMDEFYTYFAITRNELNALATCRNADDPDSCFKQAAYELANSKFCEFIEDETKKYQCLIIGITYDKNPELCEKIDSELDRDACYLELTRDTGNKTYCDFIINNTIEEQCLELNVSLPEKIIECETDEDCAVMGCNNEVCAPVDEEIVTACEWKEIYTCYQQNITSCKCIDGECMWELTDELIDCINEYEQLWTIEDLQNKTDDKTDNTTGEEDSKTNETVD